jgi:hypothetical protein
MSGFRGPFGGCSMTTNDDLREPSDDLDREGF